MHRQLFEYHPTFGYRFVPGLRARVDHEGGGYLLRVNQAGFRCRHEAVPEKKKGTFRVLLLGDSYTAGDGVSDSQRYGDVLETLLPGLEVLNFALPGSGTDQQYLVYRDVAANLEHDLVVIGVLVENIRRVAARYRVAADAAGKLQVLAKPYFSEGPEGIELRHVPVPRQPIDPDALPADARAFVDRGGRLPALRRLLNRLGPGIKESVQRLTRYQPLPEYDRPSHPSWRLLEDILLRWVSGAQQPVLVCPIPLYQYVEGTASPAGYRARFEEFQRVLDSGLPPVGHDVHDPLDDFRRHSPAQRRAFRFDGDCHFTPAAHRVLAQSLAPRIRAFMPPAQR